MNSDKVLIEVQKICLNLLRVPPEKVVPEARLVEDLDMDSLFAAELGMAIDRTFNVDIPAETIPSLKTVADVAAYISAHLKNKPA